MRKQRKPEEIPDLLEKCEKYGITYERACWLLTCPVINFAVSRPKRIIRNMSEYGPDHHISQPRNTGVYYLKLKVGWMFINKRLTTNLEESRRMRDETIAELQKQLEAGELDMYFLPRDGSL